MHVCMRVHVHAHMCMCMWSGRPGQRPQHKVNVAAVGTMDIDPRGRHRPAWADRSESSAHSELSGVVRPHSGSVATVPVVPTATALRAPPQHPRPPSWSATGVKALVGEQRGSPHLQVTIRCGRLTDGSPLLRPLFLRVHEIPRHGAAAGVHGGFPQQDQRRVSDLAEGQVVGRT